MHELFIFNLDMHYPFLQVRPPADANTQQLASNPSAAQIPPRLPPIATPRPSPTVHLQQHLTAVAQQLQANSPQLQTAATPQRAQQALRSHEEMQQVLQQLQQQLQQQQQHLIVYGEELKEHLLAGQTPGVSISPGMTLPNGGVQQQGVSLLGREPQGSGTLPPEALPRSSVQPGGSTDALKQPADLVQPSRVPELHAASASLPPQQQASVPLAAQRDPNKVQNQPDLHQAPVASPPDKGALQIPPESAVGAVQGLASARPSQLDRKVADSDSDDEIPEIDSGSYSSESGSDD